MAVSVFDLFSIGIGPSSSHTVGPMRAAGRFARHLADDGLLPNVARVRIELYGSLGATGAGHGTPGAVVLGLEGSEPETVDPALAKARVEEINAGGKLLLAGTHTIQFDRSADIVLSLRAMDFHSNGMVFLAFDGDSAELSRRVYYSVGGGFVVDEQEAESGPREEAAVPYPFNTAEELVRLATENGCSIAELMARNEAALGREPDVRAGLLRIWAAMRECVDAGLAATGTLPGKLRVKRRARLLAETLDPEDPLYAMDWLTVYALAVNEENAGGGRVVTAPTNGAAGVIPAVLHYYSRFVPGATDDGIVEFLLTAGAIGHLFKANASISGAEVAARVKSGRRARWRRPGWRRCSVARRRRSRMPPRSVSSTTSG
jgi:L-serine dehydratase